MCCRLEFYFRKPLKFISSSTVTQAFHYYHLFVSSFYPTSIYIEHFYWIFLICILVMCSVNLIHEHIPNLTSDLYLKWAI